MNAAGMRGRLETRRITIYLVAAAVVTQTLVELLAEPAHIRLVPSLIDPGRAAEAGPTGG